MRVLLLETGPCDGHATHRLARQARALRAVPREARLELSLPGRQLRLWCADQRGRLESARQRADEPAGRERIVAHGGVADRDPARAEAALENRRIGGARDGLPFNAILLDERAQMAGRTQSRLPSACVRPGRGDEARDAAAAR